MNSKAVFVALLCATLVAVSACSDDTSTTTPVVSTTPTLGSTYTYRDSSTGIPTPSSDFVYIVVESKDNRYAWRQDPTSSANTDTTRFWYSIEPNGNLKSLPQPVTTSRADWFTMPYITKAQITSPPDGDRTMSAVGEADGTVTIMGKSYVTKNVKVMVASASDNDTMVYHYHYAPELGVEVGYDQEDWSYQGAVQEAHHRKLVSFVKK